MTRLKYGNKITVVDGIKFRSLGESRRYQELKLLEKAGHISNLDLQVKHTLEVKGYKVGTYTSDFEYDHGIFRVIEDFKGVRTALFTLKWNILRAMYAEKTYTVLKLTGKASKNKRGSPR